jgi:hypothetical protein
LLSKFLSFPAEQYRPTFALSISEDNESK